jgi:dienelactone hydrolase
MTDNKYHYVCVVNSLDHIINKQRFDKCLKKFLNRCEYYKINYYTKIDEKYHIFDKQHIIEQINIIKKQIITDHITRLQDFLNENISNDAYIQLNSKIMTVSTKSLMLIFNKNGYSIFNVTN